MADCNIIPALYLLPTGLSDSNPDMVVPPRNIEIMNGLRYFVVENVRTARRWIKRCNPDFDIDGAEFVELNVHTAASEIGKMLEPLRRGLPIGVLSEAGCPAVADPGADIVAAAQKENLKVMPLVGPSSILLGLMGSGFNGQSFCFHGYLPIDDKKRRDTLLRLERDSRLYSRTQIFIETPYRNSRLLQMLKEFLSADTLICIASDITGPAERIVTKSVAQWRQSSEDPGKVPAIFLLFSAEGAGDELIYSKKGGKRRI